MLSFTVKIIHSVNHSFIRPLNSTEYIIFIMKSYTRYIKLQMHFLVHFSRFDTENIKLATYTCNYVSRIC